MKKHSLYVLGLAAIFASSCQKFLDVNTNPNSPTAVTEKLLLAPIEVNVASEPGFWDANSLLQNIALNQAAPNSGTYQYTNTTFDGPWGSLYATGIKNMKLLDEMGEANGNLHYAGIAKILMAYNYAMLTDLYGDIPFTDAIQGISKQYPAYDPQETVYTGIQSLLDQGIANINSGTGVKPTSDDFFYAGDMDKWKRMAYTLKARYHMRLSKVYGAATQADLVLADLANAMTSNADDMKFTYPGTAGYYNRWYNAMLPVETVTLGSTLVDSLVSRNDPRLSYLVAPAVTDGAYRGRQIGISFSSLPPLSSFSVVGSYYGGQSSPVFMVNYSEALFLKAEATFIKSGAAAAEPIYQSAVKAHMTKLGVSTAAADAYIASRGAMTDANAMRLIMEEKAIANYLMTENYNDWRRTGYPSLSIVTNASLSAIPRRFLYPQTELNTNPLPIQSASLTDRVWWDKQ